MRLPFLVKAMSLLGVIDRTYMSRMKMMVCDWHWWWK